MALEGSLTDFGLADILQLIYFQKKSGILSLSGHRDKVQLIFSEGNVVSAESRKRMEDNRLGKILLKKGLIKGEDLRSTLEEQKRTGARIGDVFLRKGLVTKEDIKETLISQMTETVVQLFSWKEGTYEFQSQEVSVSKDLALTLDTQHLLMEGLRIMDEWSLAEGKILPETVFTITGKTGPALTTEEETILNFVDGENDVSIIIDLCGMEDFQASRIFLSLLEREIIEPVKAAPVKAERVAIPVVHRERPLARFFVPAALCLTLIISLIAAVFQGTGTQRGFSLSWNGDSFARLRTVSTIEELRFMAEVYRYRNGSYPSQINQIGDARDSWGRPFIYSVESGNVMILSTGPDGKAGTADDLY
ncbi:MAG TPA: DUF4388 domain-containing protein [Thermodesulfovibrionales bacterium]|nr:DUF4388 domain-containing protein [Thermodesulfovibrionales bacterium]